jgi:hypothetical protein
VGVPGVPRQIDTAARWAGVIASGWNGRSDVILLVVVMAVTWRWSPSPTNARRTRGEARAQTLDPHDHIGAQLAE